jgi:hypothetical protein
VHIAHVGSLGHHARQQSYMFDDEMDSNV